MFKLELTVVVLSVGVFVVTTSTQQRSRRPLPAFKQDKSPGLNLPDNATSIRENIVDTFSCDKRIYGYYADVNNECQIFHVCVPQTRKSIRYSFICPAETVFNQVTFVCTRNESSIPCEESEKYYKLNEAFGKVNENTGENNTDSVETTTNPSNPTDPSQKPIRPQGTTDPTQWPTRPQQTIGPQIGSTNYPQRPTGPPTYPPNTTDYLTTQFTQRPPKPNQGNRWRP